MTHEAKTSRRGRYIKSRDFLWAQEVADLAGITGRQVLTLAKDGTLPSEMIDDGSGPSYTFKLTAVGEWLRGRQDGADLNAERVAAQTRKDNALARKTELEIAVREGELMEASDVIGGWQDILARVRTRLLQVPTQAAPLVVGEADAHTIRETLESYVRDALTELSAPAEESTDD
jgi:hypothetical protein